MKLYELKVTIDAILLAHPEARVDFGYPIVFRGKPRTKPANITGYRTYSVGSSMPLVRFLVDHARDDNVEPSDAQNPG